MYLRPEKSSTNNWSYFHFFPFHWQAALCCRICYGFFYKNSYNLKLIYTYVNEVLVKLNFLSVWLYFSCISLHSHFWRSILKRSHHRRKYEAVSQHSASFSFFSLLKPNIWVSKSKQNFFKFSKYRNLKNIFDYFYRTFFYFWTTFFNGWYVYARCNIKLANI